MSSRKPALEPLSLEPISHSSYPEPYRSRVMPRFKRQLGNALGLTRIGINHTTLASGKESSMRHWHTHEDEFVFVVSGEVVLVTDQGEETLVAGDCAAFPGGVPNGHQIVNRGTALAVCLEIGSRIAGDGATYPDIDLLYDGKTGRYTHRDGTPYPER